MNETTITKNQQIATLTTARKAFICKWCGEIIKPREQYYSIIYAGSGLGGLKYPDRVHIDCVEDYLNE